MKERGKEKQRSKDIEEIDDFEPSESEGLDDEEQQLLDNAVGRRSQEGEEEVFGVYSSSDDSGGEEIPGEDIDSSGSESEGGGQKGANGLPDPKAWGPDRKQYYHTDYVDKDYSGFDDEAAALAEEGEAAAVQGRLLAHLDGVDFSLGLFQQIEDKKVEERAMPSSSPEQRVEEVAMDLSSLSSSELLHLLQRQAPHLLPILTHCKKHINYLKTLIPVLELCKEAGGGAATAIRLLYSLILHYSTNVLLLVYLEESGEGGQGHPSLRRIAGFRLLLEELQPVMNRLIPQLDWINQKLSQGDQVMFQWDTSKLQPQLPNNRKDRRKRKLELLKKREEQNALVESKKRKLMSMEKVLEKGKVGRSGAEEDKVGKPKTENQSHQDQELFSGGEMSEDEGEETQKRGVTFQILKNRGLTPRRKKENRNPRVKHRNKFRRALKRRRGQVREPRKEVDKYGGEISGIKKYISKSINLK